ncbi:MAG: polyprenyl diphosphate synthase [Defluviitaleaceae bacterium]|nr:polyprenyl diphosphate synthase [Defluviitaleaceae bacterium]
MKNLPSHIAIVMDGNRRWAKKRMLPKAAGHRAGAKALENLTKEANKLGLKYLTVYAFSTENWKRDSEEVSGLMSILREYIDNYLKGADRENMRLKIIGDRAALDYDIQQKIKDLENQTKENSGLTLIIAISYGGRDEILRAIKKLVKTEIKDSINAIEAIDAIDTIDTIEATHFERYLDTYQIPDPELLIRTSGEMRLSNFMLWQLAYTEIYFTETLWPDFTIEDLTVAIDDFNQRTRRHGG